MCGSGNGGAVEIRIINTSETELEGEESDSAADEQDVVELQKEEAEALEVASIIAENYGN